MPAPDRAQPDLSVIIPMLNERLRLAVSLPSIYRWLASSGIQAEIIVVDDGSTDGTAEAAEALLTELANEAGPLFRVFRHEGNQGKGAALRSGFRMARGRWFLLCDADESTPISEVMKLLEVSRNTGAALVLGSREAPGAVVQAVAHRKILGRVFQSAAVMLGLPAVSDSQCGFKLYRADLGAVLAEQMIENGFVSDVEQIIIARRNGFAEIEVGVVWTHKAGSRVRVLRDGIRMFAALLRLRARHGRVQAPVPAPGRAGGGSG